MSDELRVYLIVNTDLGMGLGKTSVQTAHATHLLLKKRDDILAACDQYTNQDKKLIEQAIALNKWHNSDSMTKISKEATTEQFNTIKQQFEGCCVVVRDAGRTEIASGSQTVIALFPMTKKDTPEIIANLPLLKQEVK
jgi:peptidyl-tRNA hydrolase, PTH2 family